MGAKRTLMRERQRKQSKDYARSLQRAHKTRDGKKAYFCPRCRKSHLRFSIIGRLHKAYFERPSLPPTA